MEHLDAFRQEVEDFFTTHLTDEIRESGRRASGIIGDVNISLQWQKILHAKGWAAPHWPAEYGGTGWSDMQRYIYADAAARHHAPRLSPLGLGMIGPTLITCGNEAQKEHFLPRILSGEDFWCQGYSEPSSGSDLASLQCRAVRDGDDYIINGTKIWTSYAQHANWIFCLVRTDMEAKPQKGISFILIDMTASGIEVQPIITLAGDHEVNQIFFADVRVPAENLVGAENDGWTVAKTLLTFERGGSFAARMQVKLERLVPLIKEINDADLSRRLSALQIQTDAIQANELRIQAALAAGENASIASSQLKITGTETIQHIDQLGLDVLAQYSLPFMPELREMGHNQQPLAATENMQELARIGLAEYLNNRAATIYGGSSEVQRNIISKIALGF